MMSVAAGGLNSITDGCESQLNCVRFWKEKAPGLNTMANLAKPNLIPRQTLRRICEAPLGSDGDPSYKWSYFTEDFKPFLKFKGEIYTIDQARAWWPTLKLCISNIYFTSSGSLGKLAWAERFGIECKRIGLGYAAHALADYKIGPIDPFSDGIMKARGHKLKAIHYDAITGDRIPSPMKTVMNNLFDGPLALARQRASALRRLL